MTEATGTGVGARERYFDNEGVRLHYLEWGEPDPAAPSLLLLHGLSSNARFWERTAGHLPGRHVVALDQRSHGLSDRPPEGNRNETFVADAHALAELLELRRPLVAGHSWGAVIALEYAAAHPHEVAGLSVMDGPVWNNRVAWDDVKDFVQPPFPLYPTLADAYRAQAAYLPGAWGRDLEPFVGAGLAREDGGYRSTLSVPVRREILQAMFAADAAALWPRVPAPVSVLLAEQGPQVFIDVKRQGVEELNRHLPQARVRWFDTPHDIPLYQPAQVAAELDALTGMSRGEQVEPLA